MNKSEIERANVMAVIDQMSSHERDLCLRMHQSLMMSVGHPISGNTFMMAIALANCDIACSAIALGIVAPDGSFKDQKQYATGGLVGKPGEVPTIIDAERAVNVPRETPANPKPCITEMRIVKTEDAPSAKVSRISVDTSDPAYDRRALDSRVDIFFNGEKVNYVVTADAEKGKIWQMKINGFGNPEFDEAGRCVLIERGGKVEIVVPW